MGLHGDLSSIRLKGSAHQGIARLLRRSTIRQISITVRSMDLSDTNLVFHVLQRVRGIHRKSNKENMGF